MTRVGKCNSETDEKEILIKENSKLKEENKALTEKVEALSNESEK